MSCDTPIVMWHSVRKGLPINSMEGAQYILMDTRVKMRRLSTFERNSDRVEIRLFVHSYASIKSCDETPRFD